MSDDDNEWDSHPDMRLESINDLQFEVVLTGFATYRIESKEFATEQEAKRALERMRWG